MVSYEQQRQDTKNDYCTAPDLWRPLANAIDGFDLDPASSSDAPTIAENRYTPTDDGLAQSWCGKVFLNPPFDNKDEWYRKAVNELSAGNVEMVIALAPGDTSTDWFHRWFAQAELHGWLNGRGWYVANDCPTFNTVVGVFGEYPDAVVEVLDRKGLVTKPVGTGGQTHLGN